MPEAQRDVSRWTEREVVYERFNLRACLLQIEIARWIYAGKNVVACAPTGFGKTLSFWIPMLMAKADGLKRQKIILISPLNVLAQQNVESLEKASFRVVLLIGETCSSDQLRIVEKEEYGVIISNPEILVGKEAVRELLGKPSVASSILEVVLDEGHTVDQWADFRLQFRHIGDLRYTIPGDIPFYLASATLPPDVLQNVNEVLNLREDNTKYPLYSNDRPDINLMVRPLAAPANSFEDLGFLIPKGITEDSPPPPKFLVFVDSIADTAASTVDQPLAKPKVVLHDNAIYDFINLPEGVNCRREIPDIYNKNDKRLQSVSLKWCNPEYFKKYEIAYVKPKVVRRSAVKKISDEIKAAKQYKDLCRDIFAWRAEHALKKLSGYSLAFYGAQSFLPEQMIDRIIKCAYSHKILDPHQLVKETGWCKDWAQEFGLSLVALLLKLVPLDTKVYFAF
ncbi:ATP-dependent DNA helicase Q-like 3 [Leucoagaricus sp. SymC.cos]|nr:ATP-dependent DNA helicase Q-like 3 [Leucoagaricus sp. SymC.cos]